MCCLEQLGSSDHDPEFSTWVLNGYQNTVRASFKQYNRTFFRSQITRLSVALSALHGVWSNEQGSSTSTAEPHCDNRVAIIKITHVDTGPDTRSDRHQLSDSRRPVTTYNLQLLSKHWKKKCKIFKSINRSKFHLVPGSLGNKTYFYKI